MASSWSFGRADSLLVAGCGDGSDRPPHVGNQLATVSDAQLATIAAQCHDDDSPCQTIIATLLRPQLPTPRPDKAQIEQEMKVRALADPVVQQITVGKTEGIDYWVETVAEHFQVNGEDGGLVRLLFRYAVSFDGEVTASTDPCSGDEGAHSIENSNLCQDEPRQFSTAHRSFETRDVILRVDVLTNKVYDISDEGVDAPTVAGMIERHLRATPTAN